MRLLFLDIDGVLNHHDWWSRRDPTPPNASDYERCLNDLDPESVSRLNQIIAATKASVVISSTWRLHSSLSDLRGLLKAAGFTGAIIGKTPRIPAARGHEIQQWLDETSKTVEAIAILDDDDDMKHLSPYLVKTSMSDGLQPNHVKRAIELLV